MKLAEVFGKFGLRICSARRALAARSAAFIIAVLLSAFAPPVQANWTVLNSGTSEDLYAVHFPAGAATGYAAGMRGTILKTVDGGQTWRKQSAHTTTGLCDIHFPVDAVTGYAVGGGGVILKTTDGGAHWNQLASGTSATLRSVYFLDANTGFVGGDGQTLLKTTDGGRTWSAKYIREGSICAIQFPQNGPTGYASGTYGSIGQVYKTVDGGETWVNVLVMEDAFFDRIHFPADDLVGYVVNSDDYYQPGVYKTVDGGATWNPVNYGITEVPVAVNFPVDAVTGIVVGVRGSIFKTTDGGASWQEGRIDVDAAFMDVQFVDAATGYTVGRGGVIAKTTDGGMPNSLALYLHPTGQGTISEFTQRSGCTESWDCVNDQPGNAGAGIPVTADFMTFISDGSGNREYFSLDNGLIGPNQRVTAVSVNLVTSQTGGCYVGLGYQRVGIDPAPVETVPFLIGGWYPDPSSYLWTGLDWRSADIDALQIGLHHGSGSAVDATQMYVKIFVEPLP